MKTTITFSELEAELRRIESESFKPTVPPGFKSIVEWELEQQGRGREATRRMLERMVRVGLLERVQLPVQGRITNFYGPSAAPSATTKPRRK